LAAVAAQIVSGLRLFVPLEQMQGRMVVVLTNLKPAKMCTATPPLSLFEGELPKSSLRFAQRTS